MNARSFTLIELLVVTAVLVVAAGVIIPRMGGSLESHELRLTAATTARMARTLRELAMAQGRSFELQLDLDKGRYAVTTTSRDNPKETVPIRQSWLRSGSWPKSVKVAEFRAPQEQPVAQGVQKVTFSSDGTSSGAMIRFACGTRTDCVVIYPHNGRAERTEDPAAAMGDLMDLGD